MRYDNLNQLNDLRQKGVINEDEFQREKAKILAAPDPAPQAAAQIAQPPPTGPKQPWGMEVKTFCMLMHLALFFPGLGIILPIVMWATTKDEFPAADIHGRIILNWIISLFIYGFIAFALCFIFIGFLILPALGICSIIFTIMGAVKANEGKAWPYPMSIRFLALPQPPAA